MPGDRDGNPNSDEDLDPSLEDDDDDEDEALDFISDEDPERKSAACKGTVSYTVLDRDRLQKLQARQGAGSAHTCSRFPCSKHP
jgi:hypothetical protein